MNDASDRLARIEDLFHEVLAIAPGARSAQLQELCGDDALLLAEVTKLLRAEERERLSSDVQRSRQALDEAAFAQRRIGPYQLQSLLGRGGTGAVYLALRVDGQYEKTVAIKLIDVPLATELFRDRFRQERQILAGLDHPLIARLLDGGVSEEGSPYLVMDYVSGIPIDQYCRNNSLSIAQRLQLFLRVCEAVQFAHQNLVVHRDLKPDNILVSTDGIPHLLDFGTAKLLSPDESQLVSRSTQEGYLSFTPQYASPEQVLGRPVTIGSDIYSLGVLLFVLLTGRHPYKLAGISTEEMLRVIVHTLPARPGGGDMPYGRIDADLDSIVLKALRKESTERFSTAAQFAADVSAYLEGRPVLARRGSVRYRVLKFVLRNRVAVAASILMALTLLAGVAAVSWEAHTATIARRKAEARSSDLRVLSGSFLSELDDAIQQLPGSTPAQQLLVKRVSEQVDHMAQDEPMDAPTQIDVADAYIRLANLQGNPYDQNIGDPSGALASIAHALQGLDRVKPGDADDPALLHAYANALQSRGEILYGMGKTQEALQSSSLSRDLYVRLASNPAATSLAMSEAATAEGGLADELGQVGVNSIGDIRGALAAEQATLMWSRRALVKDANSIRARRSLPVTLMKIGRLQAELDPAAAISQYHLALKDLDDYPESEKHSYQFKRLQSQILRNLALALVQTETYIEASQLFEQARAVFQDQLLADPTNARDADDLFVVDENEAECLEDMTAPESGLSSTERSRTRQLAIDRLTEARRIRTQKHQQNSNLLRALDLDAHMESRIGLLLQTGGDSPAGEKMVAHATATLRRLAAEPDASNATLDYEVSTLLNALPNNLRDTAEATRSAQLLVQRTHRQKLSYLLQLVRAFHAAGQNDRAIATAREALALLGPAQRNMRSSSMRNELERLIAGR